MLYFCKKCGRVIDRIISSDRNKPCDHCKSMMYVVPDKYFIEGTTLISNKSKELLREELVKTSSEFDQTLFDNRIKWMGERNRKWESDQAKMAHGKAVLEGKDKGNKFGVSCPYCKATNVRKITITSKAIHTSIFGIFSMGRNAKNYHCDHCGSDF